MADTMNPNRAAVDFNAPQCPGGQIYTVKAGDTMFRIARRFGLALPRLIAANPQIPNANLIYPGQQICLPMTTQAPPCANGFIYTVKPGDTMFDIATRYGLTLQALLAANPQITDPNHLAIGQTICVPNAAVAPITTPYAPEPMPIAPAVPPMPTAPVVQPMPIAPAVPPVPTAPIVQPMPIAPAVPPMPTAPIVQPMPPAPVVISPVVTPQPGQPAVPPGAYYPAMPARDIVPILPSCPYPQPPPMPVCPVMPPPIKKPCRKKHRRRHAR